MMDVNLAFPDPEQLTAKGRRFLELVRGGCTSKEAFQVCEQEFETDGETHKKPQ